MKLDWTLLKLSNRGRGFVGVELTRDDAEAWLVVAVRDGDDMTELDIVYHEVPCDDPAAHAELEASALAWVAAHAPEVCRAA